MVVRIAPPRQNPGYRSLVDADDAEIERLAAWVHDRLRHHLDPESPWRDVAYADLPHSQREASKAQVRGAVDHLRALDFQVKRSEGDLPGAAVTLTDDEVERAAQGEHRRWMAERRRAGYRYGRVRDECGLRHPDLVPWAELDEHSKAQDRERVALAPLIAAQLGWSVTRPAGWTGV